jgi:hypothetical protein
MLLRFPILGIVAASLITSSSATYSREHHRHRPLRSYEVHVEQARGSVTDGTAMIDDKASRGTPESGSPPATPATGSPSIPATCNQQNASSPACYSATQQARPVGR